MLLTNFVTLSSPPSSIFFIYYWQTGPVGGVGSGSGRRLRAVGDFGESLAVAPLGVVDHAPRASVVSITRRTGAAVLGEGAVRVVIIPAPNRQAGAHLDEAVVVGKITIR